MYIHCYNLNRNASFYAMYLCGACARASDDCAVGLILELSTRHIRYVMVVDRIEPAYVVISLHLCLLPTHMKMTMIDKLCIAPEQ